MITRCSSFLLSAVLLLLINYQSAQVILSDQKDHDEGFCSLERPDDCVLDAKQLADSDGGFRAAVVEYIRFESPDIHESIRVNLRAYQRATEIASKQGAQMIVFPEDGIFYAKRETIVGALTEIPDPNTLDVSRRNPCIQPEFFESSEILRNLSCIARENKLYVIANFGAKELCEAGTQVNDRTCPEIGFFALNTNVALDPEGNFISRYRKYNMFIEPFDRSPTLDHAFFDTPFGRMGMFTCFDIMFVKPAIELIEKYNISTAIFPTFWYDEEPLLSAIQIQDGWSFGHKINLLASNIHKQSSGSTGSGIYSGNSSVYVGPHTSNSNLVIATLPHNSQEYWSIEQFDPKIVELNFEDREQQDYKCKNYDMTAADKIIKLERTEGSVSACIEGLCCHVEYKISGLQPDNTDTQLDKLVVIVRNGVRFGYFNFYEQVCALATLEKPIVEDRLNETSFSMWSVAKFEKLTIQANFETPYIYPIASHNISRLLDRKSRQFSCDESDKETSGEHKSFSCQLNLMTIEHDHSPQVLSFGLYARKHERDVMPAGW